MKKNYYFLKKWLKAFLIFFASITVIGFSFRYLDDSTETTQKMERLERAIHDMRAAMNVDSYREKNMMKIMAIIDKFNKDMASDKRYEIAEVIYEMSLKYTNLDNDLICATISHESAASWNPKVESPAGAIGLMQIMPATGMYLAKFEDISWTSPEKVLTNPIYNIRMGCRYLSTLISYYGLEGGLAAYNGGEKRAALWIENKQADGILWAETRDYIPAVKKLYKKYRETSL